MKLRYLPIVLAAILLGAHFLRSFSLVPMAICLLAPLLLLIKKRWSQPIRSPVMLLSIELTGGQETFPRQVMKHS